MLVLWKYMCDKRKINTAEGRGWRTKTSPFAGDTKSGVYGCEPCRSFVFSLHRFVLRMGLLDLERV